GHIATTAAAVAGVHGSSSTSLHVTPTNTVARRDSLVPPVPTSLAFPVPYSRPPSSGGTRICCAPSRLLGIADAAISIARWADTRDRVSPTVGFCVVRGTGVFDPPTVSVHLVYNSTYQFRPFSGHSTIGVFHRTFNCWKCLRILHEQVRPAEHVDYSDTAIDSNHHPPGHLYFLIVIPTLRGSNGENKCNVLQRYTQPPRLQ
ncbi:hypothetical protein BKA93DRAFT_448435, partial [Sparassis latifolia]